MRKRAEGTDPASNELAGWRSMLRGMSAFGGAQAVQIVVQLVRAKIVALLLGPGGMGVSALLSSSASMMQQAAAVGTPAAVAREMSLAHGRVPDEERLVAAARRMGWCLAGASVVLCALLAVPLSCITLGSAGGAWQYVFVAGAVGSGVMADTERALLQGRRRTGVLAWSTCCSASVGLAIGAPMYWAWGVWGIAPAMLALAVCMWAFYRLGNRGNRGAASLSWRESYDMARPLLSFGSAIMGAQIIGAAVLYLQNVFIRAAGDASAVGLVQASVSMCAQGASMVFASMAMDFYPRLARAMSQGCDAATVLRRQTRLVAMVTAPISLLLMVFAPLIVRILLSDAFDAAVPLMRLMAVAVFFQAISYPGGYVTMAAGNRRLFFWMEGAGFNLLQLALVCIGYALFGLIGVGAAYAILHAVSLLVYAAVNRRLYGLDYTLRDRLLLAVLSVTVTFAAACYM